MCEIYKVVQDCKPYAMLKYRSWWEDALDAAFFHILDNYSSDKGELENYATRIVGTILLNKNKKEETNDEKTKLGLDLKAAADYSSEDFEFVYKDGKCRDLNKCIKDFAKLFANDLKFFISSVAKDRVMDYSKFFDTYPIDIISEAKKYLTDKYQDKVVEFLKVGKGTGIRNFSADRYLDSLDNGIEYLGGLNGIIIVRRRQGSHMKNAYRVSIKELLGMFHKLFYGENGLLRLDFEGNTVYLTLSGRYVDSVSKLNDYLERELVGSLLSRTSLKVFYYDRGNEILLSSTKDTVNSVFLSVFGKSVQIDFERAVVKVVRY